MTIQSIGNEIDLVWATDRAPALRIISDVREVEPIVATRGARCRLLWLSPTCVDFSRAKGARLSPETVAIRSLATIAIPWIRQTRPEVIILENVVEFRQWGPVDWTHVGGCPGTDDESGKSCIKACGYGRPIKERRGEDFAAWRDEIISYGYSFEQRVLRACDYGAPTSRERLYIAMRADGQPFAWPEPTHGPGRARAHRTAAEIIDWSIPCPSIFERAKPHVPATRRRLAKGMRKFVLEAARPFLLHAPTVTGANRGEQALAVPYMIHRSNGERPGQEPRTYDVRAPHPTVVAGGIKTSSVLAFLAKAYGERHENEVQASDLRGPLGTVTAQDHHHLVAVATTKFYGTSTGHPVDEPLATVTGGGWKHGLLAASLLRYNEWDDAIASKAHRVYRFLVEEGADGPWLDRENQLVRLPACPELVIYDIGMRMLVPRELFRANGFADSYVIDLIGPRGKPLTKTEQVRLVGNSVCPDVAEALVRAALAPSERFDLRRHAA